MARHAQDLQIQVDSAGTHAYHIGEPPDARSQAAARRRGIDMSGLRARQVHPSDFEEFDLILAMDRDNLAELERHCPPRFRDRLRLLLEFAPTEERDVPDPYYGGHTGFEQVLDLVEQAARGLIEELRARRLPSSLAQ
jgi:protein-tyrosine phosphatase